MTNDYFTIYSGLPASLPQDIEQECTHYNNTGVLLSKIISTINYHKHDYENHDSYHYNYTGSNILTEVLSIIIS